MKTATVRWAGTAAAIKNEIFLYKVSKFTLTALNLYINFKTAYVFMCLQMYNCFLNIYNNSEIATKNPTLQIRIPKHQKPNINSY